MKRLLTLILLSIPLQLLGQDVPANLITIEYEIIDRMSTEYGNGNITYATVFVAPKQTADTLILFASSRNRRASIDEIILLKLNKNSYNDAIVLYNATKGVEQGDSDYSRIWVHYTYGSRFGGIKIELDFHYGHIFPFQLIYTEGGEIYFINYKQKQTKKR